MAHVFVQASRPDYALMRTDSPNNTTLSTFLNLQLPPLKKTREAKIKKKNNDGFPEPKNGVCAMSCRLTKLHLTNRS